jgi:KDO2-lipid IV(A) lauroyltransferase
VARVSLAASLAAYWTPRHWPAWLLLAWLRLMAALPWRAAIGVHAALGSVLWHLVPKRQRIMLRNLEICFPELDDRARRALAKRAFVNLIVSLAEIGIAWFAKNLPPVRVEGREHLEAVLAQGKGAILLSGHFSTLELTGQFVRPLTPRFAFMFRTRESPVLNAAQTRGRRRTADISFDNGDTRAMLRALRDNAAVWYAPDQAFDGPGAALLPFFGEPAMTNTATARIAKITGARIVPFTFRRLDDGSGYFVRFDPAVADVPSEDPIADTARLTAILEQTIRACPEQYYWNHRRFRGRGPDLPDAYARSQS